MILFMFKFSWKLQYSFLKSKEKKKKKEKGKGKRDHSNVKTPLNFLANYKYLFFSHWAVLFSLGQYGLESH